jgi:hypothetical protein
MLEKRERDVPVRGAAVGTGGRQASTYAQGRVCATESCTTQLSIYNKDPLCWVHAPLRAYVARSGGRPRKDAPRVAA